MNVPWVNLLIFSSFDFRDRDTKREEKEKRREGGKEIKRNKKEEKKEKMIRNCLYFNLGFYHEHFQMCKSIKNDIIKLHIPMICFT